MAIAGHRTTYGEPFRRLDQLSIGSDVVVTDVRGRRFFYVVDGQQVVGPDDSWVVATADPGRATLTLTTCHPAFSARQRLVVTASLDTARSPVVDDQPFVYASVAEANDALDLAPATTAVATASGSTPTAAAPSAADFVDESSDAFARGWFSDPHAWPQVVLWTLLESLVVGAGWWIARRARRRWHGAVAVALPFFFVLYFVFQNVNRLLPPNL